MASRLLPGLRQACTGDTTLPAKFCKASRAVLPLLRLTYTQCQAGVQLILWGINAWGHLVSIWPAGPSSRPSEDASCDNA